MKAPRQCPHSQLSEAAKELPPKPAARAENVSLWGYMRLFRRDILSAQPARLYRAWMAEFRTPFFRSYFCNDPGLIDLVLKARPDDFPKSNRIRAGLDPLLGDSVFNTNGALWRRQRRIIDPAFEGGRLKDTYLAMLASAQAAVERLPEGEIEVEEQASHAAADVIFRTLFSIPIGHEIASAVFHEFRKYQRSQPILNLAAFLPLPKFFPRFYSRRTKASAAVIRGLITQLTEARAQEIAAGTAPDDLATKIMTTKDPLTGDCFSAAEMVDQVAIFFLAGHETSASALAWALYLLAYDQKVQEAMFEELAKLPERPEFSDIARLKLTRDVFKEALRLYPPVPMMVRETAKPEEFRKRAVARGAQVVLSPWHLHRHERLWQEPDAFCPARWQSEAGRQSARDAYMPFSAGDRVCPGAGFAMTEGVLLLAMLVRSFHFERIKGCDPVPVAHLTVRAKEGITLRVTRRL